MNNRTMLRVFSNLVLTAIFLSAGSLSMMAGPLTESYVKPLGNSVYCLPPADLEQQAKGIVSNLVGKNYEAVRKNFTEAMKKNLSAEQIKQVWESVLEKTGNFKSQNDPFPEKIQGYDTITIRCQMEKAAIAVRVAFDDSGKVDGLWVLPTY